MRIIKRYRNRRLYDTAASRTITQADLAALVRDGEEVQVIDSDTGEDITAAILARVMVRETSRREDVKSTITIFRDIIAAGGSKSMSILKNTVLASIGMLHVTREKAEEIIDQLIKKGELDQSERKKAVMELVEKAEKSTAQFKERVLKEAEKAGKTVSELAKDVRVVKSSDLKNLEQKVEELARAVKDLENKLAAR